MLSVKVPSVSSGMTRTSSGLEGAAITRKNAPYSDTLVQFLHSQQKLEVTKQSVCEAHIGIW